MNAVRRILAIVCAIALLATLTGCVKIYQESSDPDASAPEPEISPEGREPSPAVPMEEWEDARITVVGTPATLGSWTVTVIEAELDSANSDGLSAEDGELLLKIEVELSNEGTRPARVSAKDWTLVDSADVAYEVLPADSPDSRGERNIPHNKTEDVKVYFAVPESAAGFVLRFSPYRSLLYTPQAGILFA